MKLSTAGESHGKGLFCIMEGLPAGLKVDLGEIDAFLALRQSGYGRGARQSIERDHAEILTGVRDGVTLGSPVTLAVYNRDLDGADTILDRIDSSDMGNIPLGQINEAGSTGFEYRVDSYTPPEGSGSGGSVTLRVPVSYRYSGPGLQLVESDFIVIAMNEAENDLWLCVPDGNMGESFPIAVQDTDGGVGQLILEYQVPEGYDYIFTQTNIYNGSVEGPLYLTFLE